MNKNKISGMNRQIKFKAKRLDNGEWVYGDLMQIETDCYIWDYDITDNGVTQDLRLCEIWHKVDPSTVGEYTNITDKNGVEIYEGDIFRSALGAVAAVEWDEEGRFLGFTAKRRIVYIRRVPMVEVIGNIHDNPELLEEE